jgi:hypothetical protein
LISKDYIEFNGTKLTHSVTKLDKIKTPIAVVFNRNLYNICEGEDVNKNTFYVTKFLISFNSPLMYSKKYKSSLKSLLLSKTE